MAANERVLERIQILPGISPSFSVASFRPHFDFLIALTCGGIVWQLPASAPIDDRGIHFLATLTVAIVLWVRETFEEYVVGFMLLLSWVLLGIVPSNVALSGFAKSSWLFVIAALGLGAAVSHTGLLSRVAGQILRRVPLSFYRTHVFLVLVSGLLTTPLLPTGKARTVIGMPVSQTISCSSGFAPRSNGSAALNLAALAGFSQLSFMFLTGGEFCLLGWNLLPPSFRSEFGWMSWLVATLPAGVFLLTFIFVAVQYLFPLNSAEQQRLATAAPAPETIEVKPFSRGEWTVLITLALTITGWLTMPIHGIDETWIALAALLGLHLTGVLNKETFLRKLDWGLILFFGIVNSMAAVTHQLKVDRWFVAQIEPLLSQYSLGPLAFLALVVVLVNVARLFIRKSAVVTFFVVTLVPIAQHLGVNPAALLLTVIMASESFFLSYQDGPYQIAYSSTNGQAFSHAQARKLLLAKSFATLLAIALSVPYWQMLGLVN